jgi:PEP-CTERM motif
MKKILLTSIALASCVSAFGQGSILFENIDNSSAGVTLNTAGTPLTGSGLVVELLWNNGSAFVLEDTFTSTFTGAGGGNPAQAPGLFNGGAVVIPSAGLQAFEVEGFYTSGGTPYSGKTASFTATVNSGSTPPVTLDSGSWNGQLALTATVVPEPATIALGGLGAAALLLFRRRK